MNQLEDALQCYDVIFIQNKLPNDAISMALIFLQLLHLVASYLSVINIYLWFK